MRIVCEGRWSKWRRVWTLFGVCYPASRSDPYTQCNLLLQSNRESKSHLAYRARFGYALLVG